MKIRKYLFIVLILAANSGICANNPTSPKPEIKNAMTERVASFQGDIAREEIIALREQNKLLREFQSSTLNTIYWALSAILTMAGALAIHNWWTNRKMYEADKEKLRAEVSSRLSSSEANGHLRIEENKVELIKIIESRIDSLSNRITTEFEGVRGSVEAIRQEVDAKNESLRSSLNQLDGAVQANRSSVNDVMWNLRTFESRYWESRGVFSNVLLSHIQAMKAAFENKNPGIIKYSLEQFVSVLKGRIVPSGEEIIEYTYEELKKIIPAISQFDPSIAKEIEELSRLLKVQGKSR